MCSIVTPTSYKFQLDKFSYTWPVRIFFNNENKANYNVYTIHLSNLFRHGGGEGSNISIQHNKDEPTL